MKSSTRTITFIIGILAVLLLWQQVFVMTGVLWWNAPAPGERLPAFETISVPRPDTRLVDLEAYQAAHPDWRPR